MIFLTVGVNDYDLTPLFEEMDRIAAKIDEEVVMQTGGFEYNASNCITHRVLTEEEMSELYERSRVVVCHAGLGTIRQVMRRNKPMVMVPRNLITGDEADQQHCVAEKIEGMGKGICLRSINDLERAISEAEKIDLPPYTKNTELTDWLSSVLEEYAQGLK